MSNGPATSSSVARSARARHARLWPRVEPVGGDPPAATSGSTVEGLARLSANSMTRTPASRRVPEQTRPRILLRSMRSWRSRRFFAPSNVAAPRALGRFRSHAEACERPSSRVGLARAVTASTSGRLELPPADLRRAVPIEASSTICSPEIRMNSPRVIGSSMASPFSQLIRLASARNGPVPGYRGETKGRLIVTVITTRLAGGSVRRYPSLQTRHKLSVRLLD